jgi:hypothetical protein
MNVIIPLKIIDIEQKLGRFPNTSNGLMGMVISQYGEVSDCIQLEKVRTGDLEEIADHQIRRPGA